jgi:hypothetical protein
MHGPAPHNPLAAAAREVQDVARTTRWRWLEHAAMGILAASAAVSTAIGALQIRHLYRREVKEEQRERERERRAEAVSPPPERPAHSEATTPGMGDDRRRTRREEHAQAAGHARGR